MRHIATAALAALSLLAPAAQAHASGFAADTTCIGKMIFPNADGTWETYDMRLTFAAATYLIETTSLDRQNTTSDTGICDSYLTGTCRHDLPVYGERLNDYYTFALRSVTQTDFAYEEIWKDGAVGRTIVTCSAG